ncbi:MAG: hypothetical protein DHS20C18_53110 [Saprospiraceae bacterium]|nr:MAG: hypothetical protein DHS20C18_53110 [Saprospiraceae bacterium]
MKDKSPQLRKYTGILFLAFLTAPMLGTYVWLQYQKETIRHEVKKQLLAGMDKEELVLLKFSKKDSRQLEWEHDREFGYQGQMYDIVSQEAIGDTMHYWCWWDEAESKIKREINQLVARALQQNPQNKQQQERLIDFYKNLYHADLASWQISIKMELIARPNTADRYYFTYLSPPLLPPPETL